MKLFGWRVRGPRHLPAGAASFFTEPTGTHERLEVQKRNFRNVQIDAIGIGLASAAAPFLPVFLTRLGATNIQVGLLTSMPALTGLFLAILIGNFLQTRRNIVPWFSAARLMVVSAYALTGIVPFLVPRELAVEAVLFIWALVTVPQTVVAVAFTVVMSAVAGPERRYELMSRRWSTLGLTTAVTVALVGQILDRLAFPVNYQAIFMGLSVGGLISYYYSSHISLPDTEPPTSGSRLPFRQRIQDYLGLIRSSPDFVSFTSRRMVFVTGQMLAAPLFPLFYVRELNASDSWIGLISTTNTAVLMVGYFIWTRQSKSRGSRFVLLATTLALSLYPALLSTVNRVEVVVILAGIIGVFQAGTDLVFFDEMMKTVPEKYSATFVSLAQSAQHFSTVISPLIGTILATMIGIRGGLVVSSLLRLVGFFLFMQMRPGAAKVQNQGEG